MSRNIKTSNLDQLVQSIRMMITKPKLPVVYKLLGQVYEGILQPFDKDIQGKNLIIVPDGAMYYLPFTALMDKDGKFLIERHTVSILPSATILKFCMAKKRRTAKHIVAFGNPDLRDPKMDLPFAQKEVDKISESFPKPGLVPLTRDNPKADLPGAQKEAAQIAKKFPQAEIFSRKEATETLAKKIAGNYDVIHFACHGEFNEKNPDSSCLRLAPDGTNDGILSVAEIFDLKLNAQLVILSGCETGQGGGGGDEMIGLTRSFLYAGTPCLIASLWKVDDNATCLLMSHLYENLATMGKAAALQAAQIQTMKEKKHPYYWASFYLIGDGR